jgi:HK97 gp10 family phage protein
MQLMKIVDEWTPMMEKLSSGFLLNLVQQQLGIVGQNMVDAAKGLAPVRTGFLRDSIGCDIEGLDLTLYAGADYASYVEFGTRRMSAEPFLRPAFDAYSNSLVDALALGITSALG